MADDEYTPTTAQAKAALESLTIRDEPDAYAIITGCFDYIEKLVNFRASDIEVNSSSRIAKVDKALSPYMVSHHAQRAIMGATDHLFTIKEVMKGAGTQTTYGPFTLIRGALESVAQGLYVLGERNQKTMKTRVLQLEASDDYTARQFAKKINSENRKQGRTDNIRGATLKAGLRWKDININLGYKSVVETAGNSFGMEDNLVVFWMLTSGIAHNKPWAVIGMTDRVEVEGTRDDVGATYTLTSNTTHIAASLRIACIATDVLINSYYRQASAQEDRKEFAFARSFQNLNEFIDPYRAKKNESAPNP